MNNKRDRQRLKELFTDIEVPVVKPTGNILEIHPLSERPPSQIADLEKPLLDYENVSFEMASDLVANPQAEQHNSDGLSLHDKLEAIRDLTSPMTDISDSIPSSLKSEAQTIGEMQIASPFDKQLTEDESSPIDWQDVGIGAIAGTVVTGIILASINQFHIFNNLGRFALLGGEVLCGIIGALVAKSSKKTRRDIWIGAIEGSLVPVWIAFVIFLLYILVFTSLFGV